jgi:cyclase
MLATPYTQDMASNTPPPLALSRRSLLTAALTLPFAPLALGAIAHTRPARAADDFFYDWRPLADGVFAASTRYADENNVVGGNCVLLAHADGCVLVDTMQTVLGPSLRREGSLKGGAPITHVFNSHHHFDHAGGNHAFTADCTVSAHPRCAQRLARDFRNLIAQLDARIETLSQMEGEPAGRAAADARAFKDNLSTLKPTAFTPTKTIDTDSAFNFGPHELRTEHVGTGHTDNDIFYFLPKSNILITGDLVFNRWHPFFDASANATSKGWIASLRRLRALCNDETTVVPGHGVVGTPSIIDDQIAYFERLQALALAALKAGTPREEFIKTKIAEHADFRLAMAAGLALGGVYDELKKDTPAP